MAGKREAHLAPHEQPKRIRERVALKGRGTCRARRRDPRDGLIGRQQGEDASGLWVAAVPQGCAGARAAANRAAAHLLYADLTAVSAPDERLSTRQRVVQARAQARSRRAANADARERSRRSPSGQWRRARRSSAKVPRCFQMKNDAAQPLVGTPERVVIIYTIIFARACPAGRPTHATLERRRVRRRSWRRAARARDALDKPHRF